MRSSHAHRAILVALLGLAGPALRAFAGIPGGHLEIRFYSESGPLCSPILHEPVDAYVVLVDDPCPGARIVHEHD
ncbi:MAG TPA: hypothetical protein PLQ13_07960, partial [Candidatus Krumholzibacteria bacterium]|nr:hypothetical protein [Candidatus Krumholzibacteria bacterium]